MDYLYEELDARSRGDFEQHLHSCTECMAELKSLQQTHKLFSALPEVEPEERLIFNASPRKSWFSEFRLPLPQFSLAKIGYAAGLAIVVLLVAGSLANLQIKNDESGFAVKMSLFPQQTQELSPEIQAAMLAQLREENNVILANYLQEEKRRNEKKLDVMLASYSQQLERQRRNDLQLIGRGLDAVRESQNSQLMKYEQLIKNVNLQQK